MENIFKEGQTVWCLIYGKGKVEKVDTSNSFPVIVVFDNGEEEGYSYTGKMWMKANRSLFFSEPKVEALEKPKYESELPDDYIVLLSKSDNSSAKVLIRAEDEKTNTFSFEGYTTEYKVDKKDYMCLEIKRENFKEFKE